LLTKRTFDIPQGVFNGKYEGRSELYTEISPLPDSKKKRSDPYMDVISSDYDDETYTIDDSDDISPEEDMGMAETINIDDDPTEMMDDDDPLHPRRNVPDVPVSNDSGTMF